MVDVYWTKELSFISRLLFGQDKKKHGLQCLQWD